MNLTEELLFRAGHVKPYFIQKREIGGRLAHGRAGSDSTEGQASSTVEGWKLSVPGRIVDKIMLSKDCV